MAKRAKKLPNPLLSTFSRAQVDELQALAVQTLCEIWGIDYHGQTMDELSASNRTAKPLDLDWFSLSRNRPPFFAKGFRLRRAEKRTAHRLGGKRRGSSPKCGCCGSSLVLFVDLDLQRSPIKDDSPIERLPLYYCCSCPGPVYYVVEAVGAIWPVPSEAEQDDEAPFSEPLTLIPSAFCELIEVPPQLERPIFEGVKGDGHKNLTEEQLRQFNDILGRKSAGRWDMYFSQVGSFPISFQGEEGLPAKCPNRACPYRRRKGVQSGFRPLAVLDLWNDRFWDINRPPAIQIVYHICPGCHCVSAKYTCT